MDRHLALLPQRPRHRPGARRTQHGARLLGGLGLLAFTAWYLVLVFRTVKLMPVPRVLASLVVLATQATVLSLTLGREWLVLFVYVSISSGAALPGRPPAGRCRARPRC